MSDRQKSGRREERGLDPQHSTEADRQGVSHDEYLDRLAALVASGECPLPSDLSPRDRRKLLAEVGRRRHVRLVRYIARALAADFRARPEPTMKGK
jgi:hypothetical protein